MWVAAAFFVGALWTSHAASISRARGFRNNIPKQFTGIPSSYYGGLPILPVQLIPFDSYNGHYTHMPFLNYFPMGQDGARTVGSKDAMIPYLNEDNADGDSSEYGGAASGARAMRDSSEGDEDVVKTKDTPASGARGIGDGEDEGLSKTDGLGDAKSKDFAVHVTDNYGVDNSSYDEVPDPKGLGDADSSYAEDEDILKTYDGAASGARALKGATPSKAEKAEDSSEGLDDADSTKSDDDEEASESEDAAASGARGLGDADSSNNEDEEDTPKSEGSDDADSSKSDDDEDTSKSEDAAASGARGLGDTDSSKSDDDEDASKSEDAAPSGARGLGDANSSKSEEDNKDTSKSEGSSEADSSKSENDEDAAKSEDAAVSGARGLGDADSSKSDDDEDTSESEDAAASGARGLGDSDSSKNDDDEDDSKSEDAAASGAKGLGDANSSKSEEDNKDTSKSAGDAKSSKSEEEEDSSKSEVAAASGARGLGDNNSGEGGDDVEGSGDTNSSDGDDEDAATSRAPELSTAASTPAGASKNSGARALSDPRLEQLGSLPSLRPTWGSFGRIYNNAPIEKLGGLYPDSLFGFPRIWRNDSPFRPFGKYDIPFGAVPIPSYMQPYGPQQMQIFRRLGSHK